VELKIIYYTKLNIKKYLDPLFSLIPSYELGYMEIDSIPSRYLDESRGQYKGEYINMWLNTFRESDELILGVLDVDAYVYRLNFIFGLATPSLKVASVYLTRLKYYADEYKLGERIRKEVLHELGHVHGLEHCRNPKCVMSFSNSLYDVDKKTWKLCSYHYEKLVRTGLKLSDKLIL